MMGSSACNKLIKHFLFFFIKALKKLKYVNLSKPGAVTWLLACFVLFVLLLLNIPVNSCGHVRTVASNFVGFFARH